MKNREQNIQLLRVVACIMVISIHASANYVLKGTHQPSSHFIIGNIFDSISRCAVPIFVLISGRFALSNENNVDFSSYYRKKAKTILLPTLYWSLFYIVYSIISSVILYKVSFSQINYLKYLLKIVNGTPYYHLWFMYMQIGLLASVPFLLIIKRNIGEKNFFYLGFILLLISIPINLFSELYWMIEFFIYLGYFILGYSLKHYYKARLNKYVYLLTFIISTLIIIALTYLSVFNDIFKNHLYFYEELSPFVIIDSISLYLFFDKLNLHNSSYRFTKVASFSFSIYLVHAFVLDVYHNIISYIAKDVVNPAWYIPVIIILTFITSYILSIILNKLTNLLQSKKNNKKHLNYLN